MKAGDVIAGRFVLERTAASGGMGVVWRATDGHTGGACAVKVVATADAQAVERFTREARALAELRHPGIVTYLAHGRSEGGELYLAMEWLEGEDLSARLLAAELTLDETLALATQVAAALAVTHARRIVHRDIKPSNLFLVGGRTTQVKLLDFGVARLQRLESVTQTGHLVGTPVFMAPEQARGARDVDARADVFSLGAVLYRALTGRFAFSGSSTLEVLHQIMYDDPPPPRAAAPTVPAELDALVTRMLAKDPARRPGDAGAVLGELLGLEATEAGAARPLRGELTGVERQIHCVLVQTGELSEAGRAIAATYNCRVEQMAGGVAYVMSGARVASDQIQQAARCALALRAAAPGARLGMVTGRAALAGDGPLIARARSLVALPEDASGVRIDEATAGLLGARFEVSGDTGGLVLASERDSDEAARTLLGRRTTFVGRDRELAGLEAAYDDAIENGAARVVLVTAPAGTGKSRLRNELTRRLRARGAPVEIWTGHADPMHAGAPFGLLGQVVRRAAGVKGDEPPARRSQLLEAAVARHVPAADVRRVTELLGELAGVPFPGEASPALRAARYDPVVLAEKMSGAFEEWLLAECSARPIVLVLEDLHWGDLPTVKFVDSALRALAERPLVVLGIARPEVHDLFPRLWVSHALQELRLGGLPRKASERLVTEALGSGVDAESVGIIVARAGGNAFFLEELIRQVASSSAEGGRDELPDTVLAMVAARFEAMGGDARRVVRAASVYGEVFWAGGVKALLGADATRVELWLGELIEAEVISRRAQRRFSDETEYGFRHSLLREAAYVMLTDEDRSLGHRLAAGWLEKTGEPEAVVLAEHYERGGELGHAATWYLRAAEQAMTGGDTEACVARAERGVAAGAGGELLGSLRLVQAEAHRLRGDNSSAEQASRQAMERLAPGGDDWFVAVGEAVAASGKLFHVEALHDLGATLDKARGGGEISAKQAGALARAATQAFLCSEMDLGDALLARVHPLPPRLAGEAAVVGHVETALIYRAWMRADFATSRRHARRAAAALEEAGDARSAVGELAVGLSAELSLGRLEETLAELEALIERAGRLGATSAAILARAYAATGAAWLGDGPRALAFARAAASGHPGVAQPRIVCFVQIGLGVAHEANGDLEAAERELQVAAALGVGAMPPLLLAWATLARVLVKRGRPAEALELADRVRTRLAASGVNVHEIDATLAAAEAHAALGHAAEAEAALLAAVARARDLLGRLEDDEARQACLRRVPVYARVAALARERGIELTRGGVD